LLAMCLGEEHKIEEKEEEKREEEVGHTST
jgi:hypothetical protein